MLNNEFTEKQLNDWRSFELLRLDRKYNMMHPEVATELGLTRDEHLFILENYGPLKVAYEAIEDEYYENQAKLNQYNDEYDIPL